MRRNLVKIVICALILLILLTGVSVSAGGPDVIAGASETFRAGRLPHRDGEPVRQVDTEDCGPICEDILCVPLPILEPIVVPGTSTFAIYPTRACLCLNPDGTYRIEGEGSFFLPNLYYPTSDPESEMHVEFIIRSDVELTVLEILCVYILGDADPGIPIGQTGFRLTHLEGRVVLDPEVQVNLSGRIESDGELDDCNLLTGDADLLLEMEYPYTVQISGTVNACTWQVAQAALVLCQDWGLVGQGDMDAGHCKGVVNVHVWKEGDTFHFRGSGRMECTFEQGVFNPPGWPSEAPDLPPSDWTVVAECAVGDDCRECQNGECLDRPLCLTCGTALEGLDLPSWIVEPGTIVGRCSYFAGDTLPKCTSNLYWCGGTDQGAVVKEAQARGLRLGSTHVIEVSTEPTRLRIVSLEWDQGQPSLTLIDPDGVEIAAGPSLVHPDVGYSATPTGAFFALKDPRPGLWRARITGLEGDENYRLALFCLNDPPSLSVSVDGTGPYSRTVTIRYDAEDTDGEVTASLYYDKDSRGRDGKLIADCLAAGTDMTYEWDVSEVGSGSYYVYARVDDGKNLPVYVYAAEAITVTDITTPTAPSGVIAWPGANYVDVKWDANEEADVVGYELRYGSQPGKYVGVLDATNLTSYRLPVWPPKAHAIGVRAYDSTGHRGPWVDISLHSAYLPTVEGR